MDKGALAIVAGMAISTGAYAETVFQFAGPAGLVGGQSTTLFSGELSGLATGFQFSFLFGQSGGDLSYASDMQIRITAANGNSVTIGGYNSVVDIAPGYDGGASDGAGLYGDTIDLSAYNMTGSGIWTVTMRNDWFSDSSANLISEFSGRFTGSVTPTGGVVVPIPSALGIGFFGLTGLVATRRRR